MCDEKQRAGEGRAEAAGAGPTGPCAEMMKSMFQAFHGVFEGASAGSPGHGEGATDSAGPTAEPKPTGCCGKGPRAAESTE